MCGRGVQELENTQLGDRGTGWCLCSRGIGGLQVQSSYLVPCICKSCRSSSRPSSLWPERNLIRLFRADSFNSSPPFKRLQTWDSAIPLLTPRWHSSLAYNNTLPVFSSSKLSSFASLNSNCWPVNPRTFSPTRTSQHLSKATLIIKECWQLSLFAVACSRFRSQSALTLTWMPRKHLKATVVARRVATHICDL